MSTFLRGIAVGFYSGIGAKEQVIAPCSTLNFFIGANNSGKPVILNVSKSGCAFAPVTTSNYSAIISEITEPKNAA